VPSSAQCRSSRTQTAGPRVGQRLDRRRQHRVQLGQQRPQRAGDGPRLAHEARPGHPAEGVEHRPERERVSERLAVADERRPAPELGTREQLADEARLADARLAVDHDDRGRTQRGAEQRLELARTADQRGRREPARRRLGAGAVLSPE
jgi:hypothetical protein